MPSADHGQDETRRFPRPARWSLGRYVLAWMLPMLLLVAVLVPLLGGRDDGWLAARESATNAARMAGCTLRAELGRLSDEYLSSSASSGLDALRRGVVVVRYGRTLAPTDVQALRELAATHESLVVLRSDSFAARPAFTAIAWRQVLNCDQVTPQALRAVRLLHASAIAHQHEPRSAVGALTMPRNGAGVGVSAPHVPPSR